MLKARQTLGKYRIQKRLAEGGFGTVFKAYDTIEGQSVALKIPHPHLVNPEMLEAFRQEVRLTAALDHPRVLPIKNAQFIDSHFVVAYALGQGTLADRMRRRMAFPKRIAFAEQLLEGVAHAHANRVIHCDLKPENLILFPGDQLRLTDFGISKLAARTLVVSGSGTVGYVAPEQAMGKTSFRSDVFSLGVILYQMFVGKLPEWPYTWPPPGMERMRRELHPDFQSFLRRALEVKESKRFGDADQMLASFRRLKARNRILASSHRRRRRRPNQGRHWKTIRQGQFVRTYRSLLQLRDTCGRCEGPVSESMLACPWCGASRKTYRGETRHPARCPRCKRGRKLDWRFCAWCYGPGFHKVATREYSDRTYTERCSNTACERRVLMPFMRYCPWCRRKVRRPGKLPGVKHRCSRCTWSVLPDFWSFCAWCGKGLAKGR